MTKVKELPVEIVAIDSLNLWEGNPRINAAAIPAVRRSIEYFGFTNPILARREDRMVIAGHTRIASLREMGEDTAPVIFLDLSEADAKLLNITDNQTGQIAGWDDGKLSEAMSALGELDMDLSLTGFDVGRIRELTREGAGGDEFDVEAALQDGGGRVERGQVWACGDHRVMCGDSTDAEDVARLMVGEKAGLMITDPPYGVRYHDNGAAPNPTRERLIANDNLGDEQAEFWTVAFAPWPLEGDAYVFSPSGPMIMTLCASIEAAGIRQHQWLIWAKPSLVLGRSHYHYRHEHIFYGWKGKTSWQGSRTEDSVWEEDRPMRSPEHPTMKPVALCERAVRNSSRPGDTIIDPFLGSGTTMIAAERLGRRCYAMEIEPRYVAVALARWEAETGATAELVPDAVEVRA